MQKRAIVEAIIDWIIRMTRRYGGIVFDSEGRSYDWGQALIRTQVGDNWMFAGHDDHLPNEDTLRLALTWEQGDWPEWVSHTGNYPWQKQPPQPYRKGCPLKI